MLKKDRIISEKIVPHGPEFAHSVAEGFRVFRGSIVAVCADGTIAPAGSTGTPSALVAIVGLSRQYKDNRGDAGDGWDNSTGSVPIWVKKGCYALPFDTAPTWADIGKPVYAVDDETVSLSNGAAPASEGETPETQSTTRLQVGTLAGFELNGTSYVLIP